MKSISAFMKAYIISILIAIAWYILEYIQFGQLQQNRKCDNIVWLIYLVLLWRLFYYQKSKEEQSMICINGAKECDGCMACQPDPKPVFCPVCGKECETIYHDTSGEIHGCDNCLTAANATDYLSQ